MNKRKTFQRSTRSLSNFFSSNFFQKFAVGRFALLAFLLCGLVGGVAADGLMEYDGFEDGDFTSSPSWGISGGTENYNVQSSVVAEGGYAFEGAVPDSNNPAWLYYDRGSGSISDGDVYQAYIRVTAESRDNRAWLNIGNGIGRSASDLIGVRFTGKDAKLFQYDSNGNYENYYETGVDPNTNTWYRVEVEVFPSNSEATLRVYDLQDNLLGSVTGDTSGATSLQYVSFGNQKVTTDSVYFDSVSYSTSTANNAPNINSTSVQPDPPLIGENVSYSLQASDSDGTVESGSLTVFKDGQQVFSDSQSFSSGSVSYTWSDVYPPSSLGDLDAKFTITDDAGASTSEWLNRTLTDTAPSVSIQSPSQGQLFGDSSVGYEFSTDDGSDSVPNESLDVDVLLDGSVKDSYSITEGENVSGSLSSVSDGSHTLTVEVSEEDGDSSSEQVSFSVDTTPPSISVSAPSGTVYGFTGIDLNYSVSDPNFDSSSCEYSKDGGARISLSSCSNTEIQFGTVGQHNVTVYASDTLGNEGSTTQSFTLDNRNFVRAETASTGSSIQELDVTLEGLESSKSYSTSSGEVNFTTLNAPRGEVEITVNSPGHVPTSETLSIDDSFSLDKTYQLTRAGISVSTRDELTGDLLGAEVRFSNGSETFTTKNRTDDSSFYYGGRDDRVDNWLYQGEIDINESFVSRIENDAEFDGETSWKIGLVYTDGSQVNKSLGTSTEVDSSKLLDKVRLWANEDEDGFTSRRENFLFVQPKEFSITYNQWQEQGLPTGSLEITVDKQNYKPRKYFGQLDSNSKLSLNAYLLAEGEGLPVSIQVYDSSGNSVENSNMTVQRDFGGSFRTVSSKKTLSSGANSFYLSPDISYKLLVNHPEYVAFSGSFSPLSYQYDPLKVYLGSASDYNFTTAWSGISYHINPESKTIGENASFNFTVIDSKASIEEFGLKVYNENNSLIKQESVTGSTSGGSVTLTENVSRNNNVTLEPYFYKNNELYTLEKNYIVREPYNTGRFSLSKMMDGLKKQSGGFAQGMISLVFALIAGLTVSRQFNSKGGGLAVLLVLGLFTVFGFINPVIYSLTLLAVLGALMM